MTDFDIWWNSQVFRGMTMEEIAFEAWKASEKLEHEAYKSVATPELYVDRVSDDLSVVQTWNAEADTAWQSCTIGNSSLTKFDLLRLNSTGREVLQITHDGRIFWKQREVETDNEFRAAMLELRDLLLRK